MEITAKTKIIDILNSYPGLEDKIIQAAPVFSNLKNPVLRSTVGRLATVERVAQVGGLDVFTFVNLLRREAGQEEKPGTPDPENYQAYVAREPEWIMGEPQFTINGIEMLARGDVPLNRTIELVRQLDSGRFLLLVTNFEPKPMVDALKKQNREIYQKLDPENPGIHLTYIR